MSYLQSARRESAGFSRNWGAPCGALSEYLARAAEFDEMVNTTSVPVLKSRYSDNAECYRLFAYERQRLIDEGDIDRKELEPLSVVPSSGNRRVAHSDPNVCRAVPFESEFP